MSNIKNKTGGSTKTGKPPVGQSYWFLVKKQFRKNRAAVWSYRFLIVLAIIALFSSLIANDKPLYCKINGEVYFPAFKEYLVDLGLLKFDAIFVTGTWVDQKIESIVYPLVPYSSKGLDFKNVHVGPFDHQKVSSIRFHHWLGTDHLGRDVLAGMIRGTRIALAVGLISMGVATIIGLFFGGLAGFFGDDQIRMSWPRLILMILGVFLAFFYGFTTRSYAISEGAFGWELSKSLCLFGLIIYVFHLAGKLIERWMDNVKKIAIPLDLIIMRFVEVMNSIPGLVLLLAIIAVIETPTIVHVMIIIGLIGWTGIARFFRSELLRVRSLDYIESSKALGFRDRRILLRHALPNALTPVLIAVAFGIAGAVLLEATLSFLGIGMPAEEISWGKILFLSRDNIQAWWLAIFPGSAIFITVTILNIIGQGLTEALNPRYDN